MDVTSENNKYVLTMKDRGTCFLVTVPIPNKRAETVRNAFIEHWCGYFGIPQVVISDNGGEVKNNLLEETCQQLGIDHRTTTPYSPQTNGRQHRVINQALRAETVKTNWALRLRLITVAINNTPIEGNLFTPSQHVFRACVNLPGQIFMDKAHGEMVNCPEAEMRLFFLNVMSNIGKRSRKYNNNGVYYEPTLFTCEKVCLKRANRKLSTLYHGPYRVLDTSEHSMLILKNNRVEKVSLRNAKVFIHEKTHVTSITRKTDHTI